MAQPIVGSSGTVTIAGLGAIWINKWEVSQEVQEKELGP